MTGGVTGGLVGYVGGDGGCGVVCRGGDGGDRVIGAGRSCLLLERRCSCSLEH